MPKGDRYPHHSGLELADFSHGNEDLEVDVLIKSDHYWKLVTGEMVRGASGPTAVQTRLGWVLSGPAEGLTQRHAVNLATTHILRTDAQAASSQKCDLDENLKKLWDLETLGIREGECSVYEEFERSISSHDGRYEVHLPWKDPHWLEVHVTRMAEWSCSQVRAAIVNRGDKGKWVASYDGFYQTRGHY